MQIIISLKKKMGGSICLTKWLLLVAFSLLVSQYYDSVEGMRTSAFSKVEDGDEDSQLLHQLKILNKPSIKTVQTKGGDIFDCVDMYKQPAFDHSLLKNHKLQMSPSSLPQELKLEATSLPSSSLRPSSRPVVLEKLDCPQGTVPIRRVQMEDLKRAQSSNQYHQLNSDIPGEFRAVARTRIDAEQIYYGIEAIMSVYNPDVGQHQSSSSQVFLENAKNGQFNTLQAGWMIYPKLFNDTRTRLFGYWKRDDEENQGCYNVLCSGFIQVDNRYPIGLECGSASTIGGQQYDLKVSVYQDKETGNWWLKVLDEDISIGYWPKELLPTFVDGSPRIGWGGKAVGSLISSPPMGSGHFPDKNFGHSSYMRQMRVFASNHAWEDPNIHITETINDNSNCYGLDYYGNIKGEYNHFLEFGGPGGDCQG